GPRLAARLGRLIATVSSGGRVVSSPLERTKLRYVEIPDLPGTETRVFAAYGDDTLPVGVLTIDEKHATVELVFVEAEVRRRGVATALLACARELTGLALELDT